MSLMALLNLTPGQGANDFVRPEAKARTRDADSPGLDFTQTLQRSRDRLDRPATRLDRPATVRPDAPRPRDESTPRKTSSAPQSDRPADIEGPRDTAPRSERRDGTTTDAPTQRRSAASDDASLADEGADVTTTRPDDAAEHDEPTKAGEGESATAGDGAADELAEGLRAWLRDAPLDADGAADDAAELAAMLQQVAQHLSPEALQAMTAEGDDAGDALARLMQQLTSSGGASRQSADPLAALMAMKTGHGKATGHGHGHGFGFGQGARGVVEALAGLMPTGEGKAEGGKGTSFGQMFAQTMSSLSAMLPGAGADQAANQGGELEALLSQLAAAMRTGKSAQASAGSELLNALVQAGSPPGASPAGQPMASALTPTGAGQAMDGEVDGQANASRLARALQGAVNQGGGTMTLRMTPPELGTVRIQLQVQAGTVSAALHAEGEGARSLLNGQLSQLRQSLESQGLHVERLSVQPMNGNASANASQQEHSDATPNDGRSRDEYRGSGQRQGGQREGEGQADVPGEGGFERLLDEAAG